MKKHLGTILLGAVAVVGLVWTTMPPEQLPVHTLPPSNFGVTNPDVTQDNIGTNICNPSWSTSSIRPSVSYTNALKKAQLFGGYYFVVPGHSLRVATSTDSPTIFFDMGYATTTPALYEEDHVISLELGGSPDDPANLWPEPYTNDVGGQNLGAHEKDKVENYLHSQVCSGAMTLVEAQTEIKTNWVAVYAKMKGLNYTGGESVSDN